MIIKVDAEGRSILNQLFDIALKSGGMGNFEAVVKIMNSVEDIKEEVKSEAE